MNGAQAVVGISLHEHAGIVEQVKLAHEHLLLGTGNDQRKLTHAVLCLPGGTLNIGVFLLTTSLEAAGLLQHQACILRELDAEVL